MDLTQLANLGEFIGGVAVLVTLVYVAVQVRQGAVAQRAAADIAASAAIQNSANRYSVFRTMITDESTAEVWAKARRDEGLSHTEELRLRAVIQELAYSAVATSATWRATGHGALLNTLPNSIVWELQGSTTMRRAWIPVSEEMRAYGWNDLADEVTARLDVPDRSSQTGPARPGEA